MESWALWAGLGATAALSAALGYGLGRSRRCRVAPAQDAPEALRELLRRMAAAGPTLDLLPATPDELPRLRCREPVLRCRPRALEEHGLVCELAEGADPKALKPGQKVTCFFAPRQLEGRSVNAFASLVAAVDTERTPPRLLLAAPAEALDLPRRRHVRKRVMDQRFVRVRVWLAEADTSQVHFPDTSPDIWINAYDDHHGEENTVTNISAGGLALEVRAATAPKGLAPGCPVVVKCSLFQFKDKMFRPYWYAGQVRALDRVEGHPSLGGVLRLAIGFTHVGVPDSTRPQGIAWTEQTPNEPEGVSQ